MDHDEVREQLELAAVEPAGIDRLMAGDTPVAASVAGHLAGCPSCTEELMRLRRSGQVIGDVVRTTPPPELRERTLAFVREFGRVPEDAAARAGSEPDPAPVTGPARPVAVAMAGRGRAPLAWVAALAAAVVISVAATGLYLDRQFSDRLAAAESGAAGLARVTGATLQLTAEPDVERVALEGENDLWGTLVYSPAKAELAVVANGLTEPAPDREYRCWVEVDGERSPVGKMFFGGDLAFWAGRVDAIADLPSGATFGVSLVSATGDDLSGPAVLAGAVGR